MEADGGLRIGELAQRAGTDARTIRYYESIGLLPDPERSPSNYRVYSDTDVERLLFIRSSRALGFGLDEIAEILAFKERSEPPCGYVLERAGRRMGEVDDRIAQLEKLGSDLRRLIARADSTEVEARYCSLIEHRAGGAGDV
ncbi:MAG: heavy metal-responsive transcriptional regulator [Actinomycetota bacterium]